ncbi:MAG: MATE family efflux transporter [Candidatus Cryptobacteroides sp.]
MTTEPIPRLILGMAVPTILSMLVTNLYNLADTFFVGQTNTQSTAALGVVFPFMSLIQAVSFFFGHGSGNYISRQMGARQSGNATIMAVSGLTYSMVLVALAAALGVLFCDPVLMAMGSTPTILPYARPYFIYILLGAPFISGSFVLNNQMRLQGNASLAMVGILSGALLNIVLDPLFIFGLGMGVSGAGLATFISQAICFGIMLKMSFLSGGVGIHLKELKLSSSILKEITAGGLPSLFRQGLMAISTLCLNLCASRYGDSSVAAFSIVGRVVGFALAVLIGFGQGFQPVCGFNFGAQLYGRVRKGFRFSVSAGTVYCAAVAVLGLLFAPEIIRLFMADDPEVLSIGTRALRWQCATFPALSPVIMTNMYLQTTRQTIPAVIVALARQGLFLIPAVLVGTWLFGLDGLILSQSISDVFSLLLVIPLAGRALRRMGK